MVALVVDDLRDIGDGTAIVARTSQDGLFELRHNYVDLLFLDHDLGTESDDDGYAFICGALAEGLVDCDVILVTSNPVGRDRMAEALKSSGYQLRGHVSVDGCTGILPYYGAPR